MTSRGIGDVYRVELGPGFYGYAHHVATDTACRYAQGDLVSVFNFQGDAEADLHRLPQAGYKFGPVYMSLADGERSGKWVHVGSIPVSDFRYPLFRHLFLPQKGLNARWHLWDGCQLKPVGNLSPSMRHLEILIVNPPSGNEERMRSGTSIGDNFW